MLASCADTDNSLLRLDKAVADNSAAIYARELRIDSIRDELAATTFTRADSLKMEITLGRQYLDFDIDSALVHTLAAMELTEKPSHERDIVLMQLASIFNSSQMMYKEAHDIFERFEASNLSNDERIEYFTLGVQIYRNLEEMSVSPVLQERYRQLKMQMRDSVLDLKPDAIFILANQLADRGEIDRAIEIVENTLASDGYSRQNGATYHQLANLYTLKQDRYNTLRYLTQAAQADLDNGVREYKALQQLATMLYEDGDVERAYNYLHRAFDDARNSNSRLRLLELSSIIPMVDSAYELSRRSSTRILIIILIVVFVGSLMLVEGLIYVRKRNMMLASARAKLLESNKRLQQTNAIKEKYVTRFMNLSLDYLSKMERYRAELFKLATLKEFDKLTDTISSGRYVHAATIDFYNRFDEAFLELFPDFIDRFNSLLKPGEQIVPKKNERLNTELRIYALMKLGIADGDMLAEFLRCSRSTIYNYRTKIRNRALNPDTFDQEVVS